MTETLLQTPKRLTAYKHIYIRVAALLILASILYQFPAALQEAQFDSAILGAIIIAIAATEKPAHKEVLFTLATCLPACVLLFMLFLTFQYRFAPHIIDSSIDLHIASRFWHWAMVHPLWDFGFRFVYGNVPLVIAIGLCAVDDPINLTNALAISAILAQPLYILFPAVGPRWVADAQAPRNCIPSLHATWVILLVVYGRGKWRYIFSVVAVLTIIATWTTGEHYVLDIALAAPYTALCVWLNPQTHRLSCRRTTPAQ